MAGVTPSEFPRDGTHKAKCQKQLARVTPGILHFRTTQNLGRVPEARNPRGKLSENIGGSDALYFILSDHHQAVRQLGVLAQGSGLWVWGFRGRPGGLRGALELRKDDKQKLKLTMLIYKRTSRN